MVHKNDGSVKTSPVAAVRTDTEPSLTGLYPGLNSAAINLGGRSQMPSPEAAIKNGQQCIFNAYKASSVMDYSFLFFDLVQYSNISLMPEYSDV